MFCMKAHVSTMAAHPVASEHHRCLPLCSPALAPRPYTIRIHGRTRGGPELRMAAEHDVAGTHPWL